MTEEEKEGIKLIQGDIEDLLNDIENHKDYQNILEKEQIKLRKAVLNLIEKLQKENQELKEEIREFIKKELPDNEIMECCSNYDVNGVAIRKELEKILADKE